MEYVYVCACMPHSSPVCTQTLFVTAAFFVLYLLQSLQMMHKRMDECRQMEHTWERECCSLKAEINKEKHRG